MTDEQAVCPAEVSLEFVIAMDGNVVDGPLRTPYAPVVPAGACWGSAEGAELLSFSLKVRLTGVPSMLFGYHSLT
jgi:hypothetical protein